jgi:N-acetylglucosamine malate deacetylase 1
MVGPCEVLAVGAHPDDCELGCGATLARLAALGRPVGIVDLTAGEMASRGAEVRLGEAQAAAAALGVAWRACLALPDGGLSAADEGQRALLVETLRRASPRVVLGPHPGDPHPDHVAAAGLLRQAAFLAGLARWRPELGAPQRPRLLLAYPGPRQFPSPDLCIDISEHYAAKRAALAAHASQFDARRPPATHLATGYFLAAVEGRDRACGNTIGCEFAEGFFIDAPLSADEIAWLLGGRA